MDTVSKAYAKQLRELHAPKGRREAGRFIVVGKKLVAEAVRHAQVLEVLVTSQFITKERAYVDGLGYSGSLLEISEKLLGTLDPSVTPSGILAVVAVPSVGLESVARAGLVACLVDVQDPGNLGTMIRTADWFGAGGILLSSGSVDPFNEKSVAASMGSIFHVPVYVSPSLQQDLAALRASGTVLIATTPHGRSAALPKAERRCVLMGGESRGLPADYSALCNAAFTIPGGGKAESLNVAVSFGISLYALTSQP